MAKSLLTPVLCALAGLTLASCTVGLEPYHAPDGIDATFDHRASGHHLFKPDITFTAQTDIARAVRSVHYVAESGSEDTWQEPATTWRLKTGDCEDFAIRYADLMYVTYGIKCDIVLINASEETYAGNRSVEAGGYINHAINRMPDGRLYDPQGSCYVTATVRYAYSFDTVFSN